MNDFLDEFSPVCTENCSNSLSREYLVSVNDLFPVWFAIEWYALYGSPAKYSNEQFFKAYFQYGLHVNIFLARFCL